MSVNQDHMSEFRERVATAMKSPDQWVCRIQYIDGEGNETIRIVSPTSFVGQRFMALCTAREEVRWFYLARCESVELVPANDVLMPTEIINVK